jgi:C4-dicarboxylate-specific signal transduction histidine kinase
MKQDRLASLGLLAAGVAHELNNPLTSLSMQVRSLRQNAERHGLSSEVQGSLQQIDEAADRMNGIIADLLFMARPVERPQTHINVSEVLRSSLALLRAGMTPPPNLAVEIQESPPIPPIHGYASKLGQVFLNVLRNAVQAVGDHEDGHVQVRARAADDSVVITIADNGPGIPPDVLPHVTQPFFTSKVGGTGLGLWISQTLMSEHGGALDIASTGAGTTVTLRLPTTPLAS